MFINLKLAGFSLKGNIDFNPKILQHRLLGNTYFYINKHSLNLNDH